MTSDTTALVWFRGGLRLRDNRCLYEALKANTKVYCCFILDDFYMRGRDIGPARAAFLLDTLAVLENDLTAAGSGLILRYATDIPGECAKLAQTLGAGRVYAHRDYLPYPIARDHKVAQLLQADGRDLVLLDDQLAVPPEDVKTEAGTPYTVFTPFKRRWESTLKFEPLMETTGLFHHLAPVPPGLAQPIPVLADFGLTLRQTIETAGEHAAQQTLHKFASLGLNGYNENRDIAALGNSTSRLSVHLKWGTISIRDCVRTALANGAAGALKWLDELAWRDFYYHIGFHFPHVYNGPMLREYSDFPWIDTPEHFDRWKEGRTGYPFVDAGMRQLNATGWMHNRLRQVTASYLCKDLCVDWQRGEQYFMEMLTDGDWPSNNGGWQWVAGCGTDPRRATRIFNPVLQQQRYDPDFAYVKQWVPEWGTSSYPTVPVVEHAEGRRRYLQIFGETAGARLQIRAKGSAVPHIDQPSLF